MERTKRPLLLAGLILIIIAMAYFTISVGWTLFFLDLLFAFARDNGGTVDASGTLVTIVFVILLAVSICAIIVSAIGLKRISLPTDEFNAKKGVITVSLVLSLIVFCIIIWQLVSSFSVLNLIANVCLAIGVILLIVGLRKHKKAISQTKTKTNIE